VDIPDGISDLGAFRRWAHSDDFPETGRICFLDGRVWVDMRREQIFTHNQLKQEYNLVIGGLVKAERVGRFFPDGLLLTNERAQLACQPDGTFVSREALKSGRVRLVEAEREGYLELEGTPDMVLEVVSASSVEKDTVTLRDLYWRAGIPEYWVVDARTDRLEFEILRCQADGYVAVRKQGGWLKSRVFGKRRSTREPRAAGLNYGRATRPHRRTCTGVRSLRRPRPPCPATRQCPCFHRAPRPAFPDTCRRAVGRDKPPNSRLGGWRSRIPRCPTRRRGAA
jgi:Uma2 family endonuclease